MPRSFKYAFAGVLTVLVGFVGADLLEVFHIQNDPSITPEFRHRIASVTSLRWAGIFLGIAALAYSFLVAGKLLDLILQSAVGKSIDESNADPRWIYSVMGVGTVTIFGSMYLMIMQRAVTWGLVTALIGASLYAWLTRRTLRTAAREAVL